MNRNYYSHTISTKISSVIVLKFQMGKTSTIIAVAIALVSTHLLKDA